MANVGANCEKGTKEREEANGSAVMLENWELENMTLENGSLDPL